MLPNSPSDCHAPFTGPVAKHIWDKPISLMQDAREWAEAGAHPETVSEIYSVGAHLYALAQQAGFEYLWLREAANALEELSSAEMAFSGSIDADVSRREAARKRAFEAYRVLRTHITYE